MEASEGVVRAVLEGNQGFYRAFETLDVRQMESVWAKDEEIRCVHPGWGLMTGWTDVMNSWATVFENTSLMHFRITDPQVYVSGDCAWVVCVENITTVIDATVSEFKVLTTNIFVNRDQRWLMVHHHGSPISRT